MALYKVFDRTKLQESTFYSFWFRRYAPFDKFGGGTGYEFEGDHRDGPSTSPRATARTYACLLFNQKEVIYGYSGSSGTHYLGYAGWWFTPAKIVAFPLAMIGVGTGGNDPVAGMAHVSLDVSEVSTPSTLRFRARTAGAMPLLPGAPDIDTIVDVQFSFTPNVIMVGLIPLCQVIQFVGGMAADTASFPYRMLIAPESTG